MYFCSKCGKFFEEPYFEKGTYGEDIDGNRGISYESGELCPYCESDTYLKKIEDIDDAFDEFYEYFCCEEEFYEALNYAIAYLKRGGKKK